MRTAAALAGLLLLAACGRRGHAADALDAGADQRARTTAKIDADLAAADAAAALPLPRAASERATAPADIVPQSDTPGVDPVTNGD